MALRTGHGNGTGVPRIETLPPDELPDAVPALPVPAERRHDGRFASSEAASKFARLGGLAKARRVRLIDALGLTEVPEGSELAPYRKAAEEYLAHHLRELAGNAGGSVGSGPSSMIATAALQLAASRWAFDKWLANSDASMVKLGSQLGDASKQTLAMAYELAVREAQTRPRGSALDRLEGEIDGKK